MITGHISLFVCEKPLLHIPRPRWYWFRTKYSRSIGWKTKSIVVAKDQYIWLRGRNPYFACVSAKNDDSAYEMLDRLILSSVGEQLDQMDIHRLHAFSFLKASKAVIFTGACGLGKSYFAAQASFDPTCQIYSDEVTLLRNRQLLPFPIAISVEEKFKPQGCEHNIQRKGGKKKWRVAIGHPALSQRPADVLLLAKRTKIMEMSIRPASALEKWKFILSVGLGLGQMQMHEFTWRADLFSCLPRIFMSRIFAAAQLVRMACVFGVDIPTGLTWDEFQEALALAKVEPAPLIREKAATPARPNHHTQSSHTRAKANDYKPA